MRQPAPDAAAVAPDSSITPLAGDLRVRAAALIVLAALAIVAGAPGSTRLPLDPHEAFVVQGAREMAARHDWMVPWFNGAPRLAKPPMSYWLTGIVARLDGSLGNVRPVHARTVSLIAALGLVLLCYLTGRELFDEFTALLGTLVLVTGRGFFYYAHDGRPDMLYAFFCSAALTAFVLAMGKAPGPRRTGTILVMWAAYALAILTKGPQMPLAFMAASLLYYRIGSGGWRGAATMFHPFTGPALMLLLVLPWWLYVQHHVAGGLSGTQLGGALLYLRPARILNLFYLYKIPVLALPWIVLAPFALWRIFTGEKVKSGFWLPVCLILVPALMFSMGSQQRTVYLLPCLIPLSLFLASGIGVLHRLQEHRRWPLIAAILIAFLSVAPLVLMSKLLLNNARLQAGPWLGCLWSAPAAWLLWSRMQMRWRGRVAAILLWSGICLALGYALLGITGSGWSRERYERRHLALAAAHAAAAGQLVSYAVEPDVFVYYARRTIPEIRRPARLHAALGRNRDANLVAIVNKGSLPDLRRRFQVRILAAYREHFANSLAAVRLGPLHGNLPSGSAAGQ